MPKQSGRRRTTTAGGTAAAANTTVSNAKSSGRSRKSAKGVVADKEQDENINILTNTELHEVEEKEITKDDSTGSGKKRSSNKMALDDSAVDDASKTQMADVAVTDDQEQKQVKKRLTESMASAREDVGTGQQIEPIVPVPIPKQKRLSRKESFSLRGKRKSSYGELQSTVHDDVAPEDFSKHVSPDLPDPVRLRQIIVYALQKEMSQMKPSSNDSIKSDQMSADKVVDLGVQMLMEELMMDLLKKKVNTSWYHRPRSSRETEPVLIIQPNPMNEEVEARIRGYEQVLKRLDQEEKFWKEELPVFIDAEKERVNTELAGATVESLNETEMAKTAAELLELNDQDTDFLESVLKSDNPSKYHSEYAMLEPVMTADLNATLSNVSQQIHELSIESKIMQSYVEDKFPKMVDICWKDDREEIEHLIKPLRVKRRLSSAVLPKADQTSDEDNKPDLTIEMLRALSSAK